MVTRKKSVGLLSIAFIFMLAGIVSAQSLQLPSIVTVGLGYVVVEADQLVVTFAIETQDESAQMAIAHNHKIGEDIRGELSELRLEGLDFIPGRVNVWQQRSASRPSVYRATSTLGVILKDEGDVGQVVDIAMELGALSVQSVKFQATDLESAAKEALTLAVEDAMAKAEAISKSTDTRVVTIRRVTDTNKVEVFNPSDPVLLERTDSPKTPYQMSVERGEILVQVEVTMEFDLASR